MTGFLVFALLAIALFGFIAGQWVLGVVLLGGAAICLLLIGRQTVKRSAP